MNSLIRDAQKFIDDYDYLQWARAVKNFFWNEFCDWYIEMSKIYLYNEEYTEKTVQKSILIQVLDTSYRLLHPIMPFITEEIWQKLPISNHSIMVSEYPTINKNFEFIKQSQQVHILMEIIYIIRNMRAEVGITPEKEIDIVKKANSDHIVKLISDNKKYVFSLAKCKGLSIEKSIEKPSNSISSANGRFSCSGNRGEMPPCKERGRWLRSMILSWQTIRACSIMFSSSLMFPG